MAERVFTQPSHPRQKKRHDSLDCRAAAFPAMRERYDRIRERAARIGHLAGGGPLRGRSPPPPWQLVEGLYFGLEGFAEPRAIAAWPHIFLRMGAARRILDALRDSTRVRTFVAQSVR